MFCLVGEVLLPGRVHGSPTLPEGRCGVCPGGFHDYQGSARHFIIVDRCAWQSEHRLLVLSFLEMIADFDCCQIHEKQN